MSKDTTERSGVRASAQGPTKRRHSANQIWSAAIYRSFPVVNHMPALQQFNEKGQPLGMQSESYDKSQQSKTVDGFSQASRLQNLLNDPARLFVDQRHFLLVASEGHLLR